jgi:hypothetical protein
MNRIKKFITFLLFLVVLVCAFTTLPTVYAASSNQEKAQTFVTTVLPFDTTKYNITMTNYVKGMPIAGHPYEEEGYDYTFSYGENTIVLLCMFDDSNLSGCIVKSSTGPLLYETPNGNLLDSAKRFLEKYQTTNKEDLTDMLNALSKVNTLKETTITSGNIKLQIIINTQSSKTVTTFQWFTSINGIDYTSMLLSYHNNDFHNFFDNRGLSTIGNTDINISAQQATELALQYIKTYSYKTVSGSEMTGFNISIADITCKPCAYPYEPSVLGPCWNIQLPFEEFVGSTWALTVFVSANTGEIYSCTPLAVNSPNFASSAVAITAGYSTISNNGKSQSTNTKTDLTLQPINANGVASEVISSDVASDVEPLVPVFGFGMTVFIAFIIVTVAATAVLVVKKRR